MNENTAYEYRISYKGEGYLSATLIEAISEEWAVKRFKSVFGEKEITNISIVRKI